MESWRQIPSHPNYEVSDEGRVRRLTPGRTCPAGRMLRPSPNANGYPIVKLDTKYACYVHRLVVEAFVGPIPRRAEVHHRDKDRGNARLSNLEVAAKSTHRVLHRRDGCTNRLPGEGNPLIRCTCACGEKLRKYDERGRPRTLIHGHNLRVAA